MVAGIGHYVAESKADWDLWIEPRGRGEIVGPPVGWRPDGIVARVTSRSLADAVLAAGIPTVDVSWYRIDPGIPRCSVEERNAAEVAAGYLADLGLRRFGYVGSQLRPGYVDGFAAAFAAWAERLGWPLERFAPEAWANGPNHGPDGGLCRWLASLTTPIGLLTFDSFTARRVVEACRTIDVDVPGRVAVLAGEHDELVSRLVAPRLSSLDHAPEQVGRRAARLLAEVIAGLHPGGISVELPTGGVITRESTDMLAIDDPVVTAAVRFIRARAHEGIDVADVAGKVRASRRLLEQRFRKYFDRSPAEEIRRAKVERARRLLAHGDDALARVARACGFEHPETFTRAFQHEAGMTPSHYRRRFRSFE